MSTVYLSIGSRFVDNGAVIGLKLLALKRLPESTSVYSKERKTGGSRQPLEGPSTTLETPKIEGQPAQEQADVPWNPGVKWIRNQWGVWEDNPDYQGSRFGRHRHRSQ